MALSIYPINLGDVEIDHSFLVWGTKQGTTATVPNFGYLILGADKPIVVDTSFRSVEGMLATCNLTVHRNGEHSLEGHLARFNLKPSDIGYIVHTHLHVDHTGLDDKMPNAKILLQRQELQYAAAPLFPVPFYDREDIAKLVGPLWDRVILLEGDSEIFPGIRAVVTGGHTPGHQILYVALSSGTAIITGDLAYLSEAVDLQMPSGYWWSLPEVMKGLACIKRDAKYILPMHDMGILERYPEGIK
jgi:N-acyl homoserine lactone hydrolase